MFGHKTFYVVCEALAPMAKLGAGHIRCVSTDQSELRPGAEALALIGWGVLLFSGRALDFTRRGGRSLQKPSVCRGGVVTRGFHDYRMTGKSLGTARVGGLSLKQILGGL